MTPCTDLSERYYQTSLQLRVSEAKVLVYIATVEEVLFTLLEFSDMFFPDEGQSFQYQH